MSQAFNLAYIPSTSAFPTQQPTYREMVQRRNETRSEQTKQPKVQPPARYKKRPAKSQVPKAFQTDLRFCQVSGPPSFDPYAIGASTTGDYYFVASGQITSDIEYSTATGVTEYDTAASSNPTSKRLMLSFGENTSRPLSSGTQIKSTSKKV